MSLDYLLGAHDPDCPVAKKIARLRKRKRPEKH